MNLRRRAALGVFWGTVERAASQGISLVIVLVLARLLGPENYGLVALAGTVSLFGQTLLGETFSQAIVQEKHLAPEHANSLFWLLLVVGLLGALLQFLAADRLAAFFGHGDLAPILRALCPLLPLAAVQAVPMALCKRSLDFRTIAKASTAGATMGGVVGIGLALGGAGVWSLVANLLIQQLAVTLGIWRQTEFRPRPAYSHAHVRQLWSYGQYNFLSRIAAFVANQSPRLIVGYFFGVTALGAFSLGLRIVEILYQLLTLPIVNVTAATIPRVIDSPKRLETTILAATQLAALVSTPVFIGLALISPLLVPIVFGPAWIESVTILQILCIYGVVGTCGLVWGAILAGLGRPDLALWTTTAAAIVNVTIMVVAAPFGLAAAASAFVVRGYVTLPLMPVVIARLTGIAASAQFRALGPVMLAATTMALATEALLLALEPALAPIARIAIAIPVAAIVYASSVHLWARPTVRLGVSLLKDMRTNTSPAE